MAYDILFFDRFKLEVQNSFYWYESKRENLGDELIYEIDLLINYIQKFPEHYQIKYRNKFREAPLKKFPFIIIFELLKNKIIVYSLFPTKENPLRKPS